MSLWLYPRWPILKQAYKHVAFMIQGIWIWCFFKSLIHKKDSGFDWVRRANTQKDDNRDRNTSLKVRNKLRVGKREGKKTFQHRLWLTWLSSKQSADNLERSLRTLHHCFYCCMAEWCKVNCHKQLDQIFCFFSIIKRLEVTLQT